MKEIYLLIVGILLGVALGVSFSNMNKANSVNPVKLAEYSACLNMSTSNWVVWSKNYTDVGKPLSTCNYLKP